MAEGIRMSSCLPREYRRLLLFGMHWSEESELEAEDPLLYSRRVNKKLVVYLDKLLKTGTTKGRLLYPPV